VYCVNCGNSHWKRAGAEPARFPRLPPHKQALLPDGTASFANYTSYNNGINGLMVDIVGALPTAFDFSFKTGGLLWRLLERSQCCQGPASTGQTVSL